MADATVDDVFQNDTHNYDVTVHHLLNIILIRFSHCRAGDITKDRLDDQDLAFIAFKDAIPDRQITP